MQTMRELFYDILGAFTFNRFAASTELCQNRHISARDILEVDLVTGIVFVTDDQRGAGDIFKNPVTDPQFIELAGGNFYRCWNVSDLRTYQCKTRFLKT